MPSSDKPCELSLSDEQVRKDLARVTLALLTQWELPPEDQLRLLGLTMDSLTTWNEYRSGDRALPFDREILDRTGHLMSIHRGLRLLFPEDGTLRRRWVHIRNADLQGCTPVEIMFNDAGGLARVRRMVEGHCLQ